MFDEESRQKAVKITVTGIELGVIEEMFIDATRRARGYDDRTRDGQGSFADMASLQQAYYQAADAARVLYLLTGQVQRRTEYETATRQGRIVNHAISAREREVANSHKAADVALSEITARQAVGVVTHP